MIAKLRIEDGMVYVGASTGRLDAPDGCVIDPALPVSRSSKSAGPLGYWPSYTAMTGDQRRVYLEWLSSGKRDPLTDIGYVFLYFYGLERRLLLDSCPSKEAQILAHEIERLRAIYATNHSFDSYSRKLLDTVAALYGPGLAPSDAFSPDLRAPAGEMPLALKVVIAREALAGRPLGFELAAAGLIGLRSLWSQHHSVIDKERAAFLMVLRPRFERAFPHGFQLIGKSGAPLRVNYRGATRGLQVDLPVRTEEGELSDPSALAWTEALLLAEAAAQDLWVHVRAASSHPDRAETLSALVTCPVELRSVTARSAQEWAQSLVLPAELKFGELAERCIGLSSAKWTARHHRQIADSLATVSLAVEPDPDEGTEHLHDESIVQVFRWTASALSHAYTVAATAAVLVMAVAKLRDDSAAAVADFWLTQIGSRLTLTAEELSRLRARLSWLGAANVGLGRVKRSLASESQDNRDFCAWSASVAAGAAGPVDKLLIAMLEKIYDSLGVQRSALYAGLHAGQGAGAVFVDEPVSVTDEIPDVLHPIPLAPAPVSMDVERDRLAQIRADTERVSALLANIFSSEEAQVAPTQVGSPSAFPGLDDEHAALVCELLCRAKWSRAEFEAAASAHALMPGGAMEVINEWAFDQFDEALLEDADPIDLNPDLVRTIRETTLAGD